MTLTADDLIDAALPRAGESFLLIMSQGTFDRLVEITPRIVDAVEILILDEVNPMNFPFDGSAISVSDEPEPTRTDGPSVEPAPTTTVPDQDVLRDRRAEMGVGTPAISTSHPFDRQEVVTPIPLSRREAPDVLVYLLRKLEEKLEEDLAKSRARIESIIGEIENTRDQGS